MAVIAPSLVWLSLEPFDEGYAEVDDDGWKR
jgi:hypothetical protein